MPIICFVLKLDKDPSVFIYCFYLNLALKLRTSEDYNNGHVDNAVNVPYMFMTQEGKILDDYIILFLLIHTHSESFITLYYLLL